MAVRPVGTGLFHVDGQMDTTRLEVVISNFANAYKNIIIYMAIYAVIQTIGNA
jgi:hypothetical protein